MFLIYGRKTARIKRFTDHQESCKSCKSFDLDIKVYRDYYHLFFIPVFPVGEKSSKIRCNKCTEPFLIEATQKQYARTARTPFYLYALVIIILSIALVVVLMNQVTQKNKEKFVINPKVGDVYIVKKLESRLETYYFLRLNRIKGDSVFAYHNNLQYLFFTDKLDNEDFFVKDDDWAFTKKDLKTMLDSSEIRSVERSYGDEEGFNRIQ